MFLLISVVGGVADLVFVSIARLVAGMGPVSPDVLLQCVGVFVWGLLGSIAVVCYHDLRLLKEGPSGESVARVFD